MGLTKVRANKSGGERIDCTPEEETNIRADWAKNEQEKALKEEARAVKKAEREAAFDKLASGLTEAEKLLLKDRFVEE